METLINENLDGGAYIMLVCPPMVNTPLTNQAQETSSPRSMQRRMRSGCFSEPFRSRRACYDQGREVKL
jgi:hypothetical protein